GYVAAAFHVGPGAFPHGRPLADRPAKHLARRDVGDPPALRQQRGLRALPDARRPQEDQAQAAHLRMNPSYCRMIRCASICFIVSSATPTTISSAVPPKYRLGMFVNSLKNTGSTEIAARNSAPARVRRISTRSRYSVVGRPGRIPGMYPPYLRRLSDTSAGLNWIAV